MYMLEYSSGKPKAIRDQVRQLELKSLAPEAELELPKASQKYTLNCLDPNFAVQHSKREFNKNL